MTSPLGALPAPVAWILTAGAARVAAQVGMAEVLLEQGARPDLLVGSSLGAINAAALSREPEDLGDLRATWQALGAESLLSSPGAAAVRGFAPRTGRSARELRAIIGATVPIGEDEEVPSGLTLVTSDLATGEPVTMSDGNLLDAVMASCALPVLLSPVERNGRLVVDGGLTAAAPLEQALGAGARSIVLLDTGVSAVPEDTLPAMRWWQIAALAYNHQIRGQLHHALNRVAAEVPVVIISSDTGSPLDFGDPDEQFRAGRREAAQILAGVLPDRDLSRPGVIANLTIPSGSA